MKTSLKIFAAALLTATAAGAGVAELHVNCAQTRGELRALHGANGGPIAHGGTVDLSAHYRDAAFPLMRLHDCQWPEPAVVDIHTIFRDFRDDPAQPENYSFERTDDYLSAVLATGAPVIYRLGESIEHTSRKYDVHPPHDPEKWAQVCIGIIRHYNEGWAGGFRHGIQYWEIWNEPDVRPQMWTGSDDEFLRLYEVTATAIKSRFPDLKVGGPAVGHPGDWKEGIFEPTPFMGAFLARCRERAVPLDFFSWHRYSADPQELVERAGGIRTMLDRLGFPKTESHLNEWNYLPRNDWTSLTKGTPRERENWYAEMSGPAGAAFAACALIGFQDAPLDMTCFYSADAHGFGMFGPHGQPKKSFFAFKAFRELLRNAVRLETAGDTPGKLALCAGRNGDSTAVSVLVSNFQANVDAVRLTLKNVPWSGPTQCEIVTIDERHDWHAAPADVSGTTDVQVTHALPAPSVRLLRFTPAPR